MTPESFDLAALTAAPSEVRLAGKDFKVGPLSFADLGKLDRWIKEHAQNPLQRARELTQGLDPADREPVFAQAREAMRFWKPPRIGDAGEPPRTCPQCGKFIGQGSAYIDGDHDWNDVLLRNAEGQAYFIKVVLSRHQVVSDEDVARVLDSISVTGTTFIKLRNIAFEQDEPAAGEGDGEGGSGPKAR